MGFLLAQLLVTTAIILTGLTATAEADCSVQYEAAVEEVLRLKRECKMAALYDCCEVCVTF